MSRINSGNDGGPHPCRPDGRCNDSIRPVEVTHPFLRYPAGSALYCCGDTKVICTASVTKGVPGWRHGSGAGWLTAEYSLMPASTLTRSSRERGSNVVGGRTSEIQRLIGRSLRSVVDMDRLGEITIYIDCDVLQADGGTRTASITGGYIALVAALRQLKERGVIEDVPVTGQVAAVSAGIVDGRPMLDLCYTEDSAAEVDMNFVMTDDGRLIEVQGTGESGPFQRRHLDDLLDLAQKGIAELVAIQGEVLAQ